MGMSARWFMAGPKEGGREAAPVYRPGLGLAKRHGLLQGRGHATRGRAPRRAGRGESRFKGRSSMSSELSSHHLNVLRDLLQRDYLGRADWSYALRDLAEMARDALRARQTLVALYHANSGHWLACTSEGEMLSN